jgi:hypothetical protein
MIRTVPMIAGKSFIDVAFPGLPPPYPDVCGPRYILEYFPVLALGGSVSEISGQANGPERLAEVDHEPKRKRP